ncbi:MAG: hypothetical protein QM749_15935 [Aquabacterium sp.]
MPRIARTAAQARLCGPLFAIGAVLTPHSWAGRPLGTEDAGTNSQAQCQVEAWVDSASEGRQTHVAPACGLIDGLELGLEWVKATPGDTLPQGRSGALKWAPDWLGWHGWRFGAKVSAGQEKAPDDARWRNASLAALGIASYTVSPEWTVHVNMGRARNRLAGVTAATYGTALVWTPHERWLVFGEVTGDSRTPAMQTIGMRWWMLPEQLGLDVTSSRTNATSDSAAWGLGLGWYGIKF